MSRARGYEHRRGKTNLPFVQLHHWLLRCEAWRDLSGNARSAYIELKSHFNGENNGVIGLSVRQCGDAIGASPATACRALRCLVDHGFVITTSKGTVGKGSGYSLAATWLLTELPDNRTGHKATKDFMQWQSAGAPVARKNRLSVSENANDVPHMQRDGNEIPQSVPPRFTRATSDALVPDSTSHPRNTLTSSQRQGAAQPRRASAAPKASAPLAGQASEAVSLGEILASSPTLRKLIRGGAA